MKRTTILRLGIALVGVGAMASAWVSQHMYGMQPCPWCVLQRTIFGALVLVAVLSVPLARRPWVRLALDFLGKQIGQMLFENSMVLVTITATSVSIFA